MNSTKYLFQNIILNYTKTGNYLLDYLINFSMLSFMSFVCDIFKNISFDFSLLNSYKYSNIIIESKETFNMDKNSVKSSRTIYSKNFKAIIYYIKLVKPIGIFSKREAEKINENDDMFDLFIPDQKESFLIEKDIYCQIKIIKSIIDKNNSKEIAKTHTIKLFSYNKNITISILEDFISKCVFIFNEYLSNKLFKNKYFFSYIHSEENLPIFNERNFITNRTFETIFFEEKEKYLSSLDFFLNNEEWYNKKGLPYHYGILLHGEPGCGKTSIIKASLNLTDRYGISIPLNRIQTCGELENIIFSNEINDKYIPNNKRIYIFEDIDCLCDIIKDRNLEYQNKMDKEPLSNNLLNLDLLNKYGYINDKKLIQKPEDKLTLSCLLNIIDGILEVPGRIIILSSNYIDKIDKALLRPGRIDCNICLKLASTQIIKELLSFFYEKEISSLDELFKDKKKIDYIFSPAQIMNICQRNRYNLENTLEELFKKKNE